MVARAPVGSRLLRRVMSLVVLWGASAAAQAAWAAPVSASDPNLLLWLKADYGVLRPGGTPAVPGNNIASWQDSSGKAHHGTAAASPSLQQRTNNSATFNVVNFNNDGALFNISGLSIGAGVASTYIVVFKSNNTTFNRRLINATNTSTPSNFRNYSKGWTAGMLNDPSVAGLYDGFVGRGGALTLNDANFHIGVVRMNSLGTTHFLDGFLDTLVPFTGTGGPGLQAVNSFRIGSSGDSHRLHDFKGDIAEVLIYNRSLTDGEILSISQWLGEKYDIPVVPEPSTYALLSVALGMALFARRPRRSSV